MRVLHVYKTYLPDNFQGIPRGIWEIARATKRHGVSSEVLSLSPSPYPPAVPIDGHISHRTGQQAMIASTPLSLSAFGSFNRLARQSDIVHFHFPWPLMDLLHFAGPKRPSIVTYHSDIVRQKWLGRAYAPIMHAFLNDVQKIVATSPNYRDSSPVLRAYASKVAVIPLGLADRTVPRPELLAHWRQQLPQPFLLFVGAFRYYKGLQYLLAAAARTGIPVVIGGEGQLPGFDSPQLDNLRVVSPLSDDEKDALLSLCAGFVFPSHLRSEAFGIALLEAARAGRPLISCEIATGTSYVNIDGVTGYVVPPADPDGLAAAMKALVDNPARAEEMGRAARLRYEDLFTADRMGRDYASLYRAVMTNAAQR